MMKIELTDEEVTTIMVALDGYAAQKRIEWLDSRAPPDAPDMGDEELLDEAGSAEWCWQKIYGVLATDRNATAVEAVKASLKGEFPERNEQRELPFNDGPRDVIDPFDFVGLDPSHLSIYDNLGDE